MSTRIVVYSDIIALLVYALTRYVFPQSRVSCLRWVFRHEVDINGRLNFINLF